jgi:hypothetical protein
VSAGLVAVLAAALVAGPHAPAHDVLADATVATGGPVTAPVVRSAVSTVPPVQLPEPTGHAVHAPASTGRLRATGVVDVQGIPPVALVAYQRAAAVIDAADPSCRLDWSVLAAIGQVESDNGQVGGSRLDSHGVAHPAIIGPRLDGRPPIGPPPAAPPDRPPPARPAPSRPDRRRPRTRPWRLWYGATTVPSSGSRCSAGPPMRSGSWLWAARSRR